MSDHFLKNQKKINDYFRSSPNVPEKNNISMLNNPSEKQKKVIKLLNNSNVICDSVAGSGKTTTVLNVAKHFPLEKILLLTYNSNLKIETREKATSLMINNLEVHSYHSFCVKYYDKEAFTDSKMKLLLNKNFNSKMQQYYHMIIIDECQDMTPLYYRLVRKIYKDNYRENAKICVLGDRYQSIYDFANSDPRFISFAHIIFNLNNKKWNKVIFNKSFRITYEMSIFINKLLGYERLISDKITNKKPLYLICDTFKPKKNILPILKDFLKKYKPEDILILAPSLRSVLTPCRKLENVIKDSLDVLVYVPISDEEKPDASILQNKLVFLTFHQSKGLERKVVIVYNFDAEYFKYYKREGDPNYCSNELYVAMTRASQELVLIQHYKNNCLSFANPDKIEDIVDKKIILNEYEKDIYINKLLSSSPTQKLKSKFIEISVSNLLRHLRNDVLDKAYMFFKVKKIREKTNFINLPLKIKEGDSYESVSEINGIAIPSLYEYLTNGEMTIKKLLLDYREDLEKSDYERFRDKEINITLLLEIATYYNALLSGYKFKTKQISNFNWLEEKKVEKCLNRIKSLNLNKKVIYEKELDIQIEIRSLIGYADIIDGNNLYELKCTNSLEKEHFIQLALYTCMLHNSKDEKVKPILYNILSDEMYEIQYKQENLIKMLKYIFYEKFAVKEKLNDNEFLEMVKNLC